MNTGISNYVIWKNISVANACSLTDFEGLDNTYPLRSGVSLNDDFPKDACFHMRPDNPDDTLLTDSLRNTESIIIGSQRVVDFFQKRAVKCVEYLPVVILDHKRKPVKSRFFIIHPVHPVDCLDKEKSEVTYSLILKTRIDKVKQIVLDEEKIPEDRSFFRCLNFNDVTLVRRDLAEDISASGWSGFRWMELHEFS